LNYVGIIDRSDVSHTKQNDTLIGKTNAAMSKLGATANNSIPKQIGKVCLLVAQFAYIHKY